CLPLHARQAIVCGQVQVRDSGENPATEGLRLLPTVPVLGPNRKDLTMSGSHLDEAFDVDNEEGSKFDLLPSGTLKAEAVKAHVAPTKNGKGEAVHIQWSIT